MLSELSIRNLAVIEQVHIHCKTGFHVLTGETGAGKSIIIDALSLIVGARGSSDLVRYGSDKAEIEASFEIDSSHPIWNVLESLGIKGHADEKLIIRREITAQGKSSARINGQIVNLTMLRDVGECLVNIHGQHEHQSLLHTEQHIHLLDSYGEQEIQPAKDAYAASYNVYVQLRKELLELRDNSMQALQMTDLYRFQVDEISAAKLKVGEDEALTDERSKLANSEKLHTSVSDAYDLLYGTGASITSVSKALNRLNEIMKFDNSVLQPLQEQLQNAYYQLEDVAYGLRDYRESIEFNPNRLDQIEDRLDTISTLRKKYGATVPDVLQYLSTIQAELNTIENKDSLIEELENKLVKEEVTLAKAALELSERRRDIAVRLAAEIESELRDLHMERTVFKVHIGQAETNQDEGIYCDGMHYKFSRDGIDQIEFMMSPNPGEPLRSLAKIASGGELSRIMLALKTIFARIDRVPVLVFDEVDTGVSGRAAQAIAEKMSQLSRYCQVFSITHLPQVASMADVHYSIHKDVEDGRTFTKVTDLDDSNRIEELARMLGGAVVTETTMQHSHEMLVLANEKKSRI
ncbi:DNA repair protein RecN [Paenibacillus albiflavus]|uniref:DNA repair protein RecN n=1 Tax=Paenibacillus albiflavus TaxID=2545760 RepID=A0A4R4EC08_9BACL|nr:DNA repair protein RecN [Paenibacillus albiflavus]TCZ77464.1 DNA repair protein RecN [Paenibacillus albiflavus]